MPLPTLGAFTISSKITRAVTPRSTCGRTSASSAPTTIHIDADVSSIFMKGLLPLLRPHYWPTWLAIGTLRVLVLLPYPIQIWLGRIIGSFAVRLPLSFVRIARVNIALCLPEQPDAAREWLLKEHFKSLGQGIFETA